MKKVHYDKFGFGRICCDTRFAECITDKQEEITCEKCKDVIGFLFEDVPIWIGKCIGNLLGIGLRRLFRGASHHQEPDTRIHSTPRTFRDEAGREYRCHQGHRVYLYIRARNS
jgi:hypothetical protein